MSHRVKTIGFSFEDLSGQPGVALHTFEQSVSDSELLCQPEVGFQVGLDVALRASHPVDQRKAVWRYLVTAPRDMLVRSHKNQIALVGVAVTRYRGQYSIDRFRP